mmetsp:Transcript_12533/g.35950  ORF Transcript_12533/g.35950 Transcript_12533/m.35950 type:complete len:263 (+) Transcript_12533:572-1360(+)
MCLPSPASNAHVLSSSCAPPAGEVREKETWSGLPRLGLPRLGALSEKDPSSPHSSKKLASSKTWLHSSGSSTASCSSAVRGAHRMACCGATFDNTAMAAACPACNGSCNEEEVTMAEKDSPYAFASSIAFAPYFLEESRADLAASPAGPSPRAPTTSSSRCSAKSAGPHGATFCTFSGSGAARSSSSRGVSAFAPPTSPTKSFPRTPLISCSRQRSFASASGARQAKARCTCSRKAVKLSGRPRGRGSGGGSGASLASVARS